MGGVAKVDRIGISPTHPPRRWDDKISNPPDCTAGSLGHAARVKCSSTMRPARLVTPRRCPPRNATVTIEPRYALQVTVIYQDPAGHRWAREMCSGVQQVIGEDALDIQAWSMDELSRLEPWCLAVEAASKADLIIVAVWAEGQLPPDVGIWLDTWLPQRRARPGALIGLLSVLGQPGFRSFEVQESLHEVARKCRLDFFLQDRLAAAKPADAPERFSLGATGWPATPRIPSPPSRLNYFPFRRCTQGNQPTACRDRGPAQNH